MPDTPYRTILVDASLLAYRSWWPCRELKGPEGQHTGLEFGLIRSLLMLAREYYPARVTLCWDGNPTRGLAIQPSYKADRDKSNQEKEEPWGPRFTVLRELLTECYDSIYDPEQEADEVIAAHLHANQTTPTLIVSKDQDLHQLVRDDPVPHHQTDKDGKPQSALEIRTFWGLDSIDKIPLLLAIMGDASDNIEGIKRIPNPTRLRLVNEATDLEGLIQLTKTAPFLNVNQRRKFIDGEQLVRNNYKLVNLIGHTKQGTHRKALGPTPNATLQFCRKLGMDSLLGRREWDLLIPPSNTPNQTGPVKSNQQTLDNRDTTCAGNSS